MTDCPKNEVNKMYGLLPSVRPDTIISNEVISSKIVRKRTRQTLNNSYMDTNIPVVGRMNNDLEYPNRKRLKVHDLINTEFSNKSSYDKIPGFTTKEISNCFGFAKSGLEKSEEELHDGNDKSKAKMKVENTDLKKGFDIEDMMIKLVNIDEDVIKSFKIMKNNFKNVQVKSVKNQLDVCEKSETVTPSVLDSDATCMEKNVKIKCDQSLKKRSSQFNNTCDPLRKLSQDLEGSTCVNNVPNYNKVYASVKRVLRRKNCGIVLKNLPSEKIESNIAKAQMVNDPIVLNSSKNDGNISDSKEEMCDDFHSVVLKNVAKSHLKPRKLLNSEEDNTEDTMKDYFHPKVLRNRTNEVNYPTKTKRVKVDSGKSKEKISDDGCPRILRSGTKQDVKNLKVSNLIKLQMRQSVDKLSCPLKPKLKQRKTKSEGNIQIPQKDKTPVHQGQNGIVLDLLQKIPIKPAVIIHKGSNHRTKLQPMIKIDSMVKSFDAAVLKYIESRENSKKEQMKVMFRYEDENFQIRDLDRPLEMSNKIVNPVTIHFKSGRRLFQEKPKRSRKSSVKNVKSSVNKH